MKSRGIVIIDYEFPEGYMQAAEEQKKLQSAIDELVRGNPRVVHSEIDMRERRNTSRPDLRKMKVRLS